MTVLGTVDATCCSVVLLSADPALQQRVAQVLEGTWARLVVASDRDAARAAMKASDQDVCIIDYASPEILPHEATCPIMAHLDAQRPGLPVLKPLPSARCLNISHGNAVMMLYGGTGPEALRALLYRRERLEQLFVDLGALRFRCRSIELSTDSIQGGTAAIELVREQIRKVSRFRDVSVLILGETGTGKELVAEAIHRLSFGTAAPFVDINCAAVPEALFESELFGHEAGSYTGARERRKGLLQTAQGGTVFLDEIADMPVSLQPKLLRALESRRFRRVGSNEDLPLEARVVSACDSGGIREGGPLRRDLYFRLAGFTISVPPLRERGPDIELLARSLLSAFLQRHRCGPEDFAPEALELLRGYAWPGNVRELRAVVEHAAIVCPGSVIRPEDVLFSHGQEQGSIAEAPPPAAPALPAFTPAPGNVGTEGELADMERVFLTKVLAECSGSISRAAKRLGIARTTLRGKLRRHGIR